MRKTKQSKNKTSQLAQYFNSTFIRWSPGNNERSQMAKEMALQIFSLSIQESTVPRLRTFNGQILATYTIFNSGLGESIEVAGWLPVWGRGLQQGAAWVWSPLLVSATLCMSDLFAAIIGDFIFNIVSHLLLHALCDPLR